MNKVCRVIHSDSLNKVKYEELEKQAKLLGFVRSEVWERFGSINGVGVEHRKIRTDWVKIKKYPLLPAKAWKETLRDALDDIKLYEASAKEKVRKSICKRADKNEEERKRLFKLLRGDKWVNDSYLCRKMRFYKKHGKSKVSNQIILEHGVYGQFTGKNGNTWLKVPSFTRGKPVCIPLNSNIKLKGCLRLILKEGFVYIHHTIKQRLFRKCGNQVIGVDKGYSEAFADSEGNFYGKDFGKVMTEGSEKVNQRGIVRNKLYQIAKKKPHKAKNIYRYNLGKKKLEKTNQKQKQLIRGIAFQSVHAIIDLAKEVRAEDLSKPIASNRGWKKFNRLMSGWAKGSLAEALETVSKARCSRLRLVNCAYTSQVDSNTGHLEGRRVGDKFYHANGGVSHADTNAAVNIKHRGDDADITIYTPFRSVKKILFDRFTANGGVSDLETGRDRPSMTPVANKKLVSTESELPEKMRFSRLS